MIAGAAVIPAAPILVDGISPTTPDGIAEVRSAVTATLDNVAAADTAILVVAGDPAVHTASCASLAGVGRADLEHRVDIDEATASAVASACGYPTEAAAALPLELSVLALLWPQRPALVLVTVPAGAPFTELEAVGRTIAAAVADVARRHVVIASGDLSAGLTVRSPLHEVPGAIFWDEQATAAVDSSRLDGLARLGPDEARRVGARGWAPLCVLAGVSAATKLGMVVRHYSAPRGVGYLVACG